MQTFLREKVALLDTFYGKFLTEEYCKDYCGREEGPETLSSVEEFGKTAQAFTTHSTFLKKKKISEVRIRYQLQASNGQWKINNKELKCDFCLGMGRSKGLAKPEAGKGLFKSRAKQGEDPVCGFCNGTGWLTALRPPSLGGRRSYY